MFTASGLLELHRTTHDRLALLLEHCRQFAGEELLREHAGFGFPSLQSQLQHLVTCEDYWTAKLLEAEGRPPLRTRRADEPLETVDQLDGLRQRVADATAAYIGRLGDSGLNQPLTLSWPEDDYSVTRTPAFILLHVITHAFHHKGQAAAICRLLGRPTPDTDLQRAED